MLLMSSTLLTATDGQTAKSWAPLFMLSLPAFRKVLWLGCGDDGLINVGMGETDGSLSLKWGSSAGLWSQRRRDLRVLWAAPQVLFFFIRVSVGVLKDWESPFDRRLLQWSQRIKTQPGGGTWGRKTVGEESLSSRSELTALLLTYPTVNHLDLGHYESPFYYTFCLDQSISHHVLLCFFQETHHCFHYWFWWANSARCLNLVSPLITLQHRELGYVQGIQYFC